MYSMLQKMRVSSASAGQLQITTSFTASCMSNMLTHVMPMQKSEGSSSNGNGGENVQKNADGSTTYQDPLDVYCDDNPETDECR